MTESWRLANVVGTTFEGQAKDGQILAAKRPEGAVDFAKEAMPLIFVDPHDFIQQAEVVAVLASHRSESHHVFGKAGASVADSGIQKARTDA